MYAWTDHNTIYMTPGEVTGVGGGCIHDIHCMLSDTFVEVHAASEAVPAAF